MPLRGWSFGGSRVQIGTVFDDIGDAVSDIGDVFTDGWDTLKGSVPGLGPISDALDDFASGPLKDFANTAVGHVVLFAVSGGAYMAAYPVVGAQLAAAAFALPGMARGETFARAWTEGMVERVTMLIKYFIGQGIPDEVATTQAGQIAQGALDKLNAYADQYNLNGLDFHRLAKLAGVREDFAALYLAQAFGDMKLYTDHDFDPKTGAEIVGQPPMAAEIKKLQDWAAQQAKLAELAKQRAASERAARMTDLGSFKAMLEPEAAATTVHAAQAAQAAAVATDRVAAPVSVAGPTAPAAGMSTGAKVAAGAAGLGLLALGIKVLKARRMI